jgi:tRNA A-37 threonylcarbamoyl transferase component Bud32
MLQKIYKTQLESPSTSPPLLLKHRFSKKYRHPSLDSSLTKQRVTHEARCLVKCHSAGVHVPQVVCIGLRDGVLGLEWIDGWTVRELLGGGVEGETGDDSNDDDNDNPSCSNQSSDETQPSLQTLGLTQGTVT